MGVKLPESAADPVSDEDRYIPPADSRYIPNPYQGRELLTRREALNMINALTGMLLIDGDNRRTTDTTENKRHV